MIIQQQMIDEVWKPIPGFLGYEVSNGGQVRSYRKQTDFGKWIIDQIPQRILKPSLAGRYLGVTLRLNGKTYRKNIAELVLLAFIGPRPEGLEICHNDGNPSNNHLSNLRYDTHVANLNDAIIHGNICLDSRRLTDRQVQEIRQQYSTGKVTQGQLAKRYDVCQGVINNIVLGYTYKEIVGPTTKTYSLSSDDVRQIRTKRKQGKSLKEIAREFGISKSYVSYLARNKRRKQIKGLGAQGG